jgi:RNA polymerase sigma factor (TIGR02999 family)
VPDDLRGSTSPGEVTRLLGAAREGDGEAMSRVMSLVYSELRAVARRQLRRRRPHQTLDTSALVHEAYLKLMHQKGASFEDRAHFFSVAGVTMRNILVDAARRRAARKRGSDPVRVATADPRTDEAADAERRAVEVLALDEALTALAACNERLSQLVELRYFAGLSEEEVAEQLGLSERTVRREWRKARAFLFDALRTQASA